MTEIEQMVFDAMSETLYIDEPKFFELIQNWQLTPEYKEGKLCGVVMTKGPEIHFVTAKLRSITRADLRKYLIPLIQTFGYAQTRAPIKDVRQARFNQLIGFELYGQEGIDNLFRITCLKGSQSCQQSQ